MISPLNSLTDTQYWVLLVLGLVVLILTVFVVSRSLTNAALREEISERQRYIGQTRQLQELNAQIAQGLATLSATRQDDELRKVLNRHGITFSLRNLDPNQLPPGVTPGGATQ